MKIGMLVRDNLNDHRGIGIIAGFDKDDDPVVWFLNSRERTGAYSLSPCYSHEIQILEK